MVIINVRENLVGTCVQFCREVENDLKDKLVHQFGLNSPSKLGTHGTTSITLLPAYDNRLKDKRIVLFNSPTSFKKSSSEKKSHKKKKLA